MTLSAGQPWSMSDPQIMIVAGEASGDLHGANLVKAIKELAPRAAVCGMGGEAMAAQGVEILYDAARMAVVGLVEVLSHYGDIRAAQQTMLNRLRKQPPQLLILIDYPGFNLWLAKKAKRLGITIFYYISPQVWAWHASRVKTIRRLVDRMAVILPFEQEFYRQRGMEVEFVGHPLLDSVVSRRSREEFLAAHGVDPQATVVGLLPGSRRKELATLLPDFLAAAQRLAERHDNLVFLLPLAPGLDQSDLDCNGLADSQLPVKVVRGERYELMAACNAVLAASGTVTLELAFLDVPMVAAYRTAPFTYWLGRKLVKVKFMTLVNLVVDREVVPELLQDEVSPQSLADHLSPLLFDRQAIDATHQGFAELRQRLGGPGASHRAARLALELIASSHTS